MLPSLLFGQVLPDQPIFNLKPQISLKQWQETLEALIFQIVSPQHLTYYQMPLWFDDGTESTS